MQALRKPHAEITVSPGAAGRADASGLQLAGDHAAAFSPALALRHHLTARLEELAQVPVAHAAMLAEPTIKLPMQARAAIVVGLSASLWFGLYLAAVAII